MVREHTTESVYRMPSSVGKLYSNGCHRACILVKARYVCSYCGVGKQQPMHVIVHSLNYNPLIATLQLDELLTAYRTVSVVWATSV